MKDALEVPLYGKEEKKNLVVTYFRNRFLMIPSSYVTSGYFYAKVISVLSFIYEVIAKDDHWDIFADTFTGSGSRHTWAESFASLSAWRPQIPFPSRAATWKSTRTNSWD